MGFNSLGFVSRKLQCLIQCVIYVCMYTSFVDLCRYAIILFSLGVSAFIDLSTLLATLHKYFSMKAAVLLVGNMS